MNNDLKKVLGIYCLYDKETYKYDTFMYSYSDEEAKNYFLDQTAHAAFDLANKADNINYNRLMNNLKTTCLMRLATFDDEKGLFVNEQVILIDYISEESIENYVKLKFELSNKFKALVPNIKKKEGIN